MTSRGRKQGCFQPGPGGPAPGWRSGSGAHAPWPMVHQRQGGNVHPGRGCPVSGMKGMSQRAFGGGGIAEPSGLGRHGSAPGRRGRCGAHRGYGASPPVRSTEDSSRRSDGVSRALTGRTGYQLVLNHQSPTGPTNCLARTWSTGSLRGPAMSGSRGCPTNAVSPRSIGYWRGPTLSGW